MKFHDDTTTSNDLRVWRGELLRILDRLDGRRSREQGPAARVTHLREACRIPRQIAALMKALLELRNVAEYEGWEPSQAEGEAARNAWTAVYEWSSANSYCEDT